MRSIIKLIFLVILLSFTWYFYENGFKDIKNQAIYENISSKINTLMDQPKVTAVIDTFQGGIDDLLGELDQVKNNLQKEQLPQDSTDVEKVNLEAPAIHSFSIHNIEIGDTKEEVETLAGAAQRSSLNEYGVNWYSYHDEYHNFFMAAYDKDDKVAALFTNQNLISSKQGITLGSSMEHVLAQLGEPASSIQKGFVSYQIQNEGEYSLFQVDKSYITVFYDKHEQNSVTAIQIISNELEQQKKDFYPEENQAVKDGFEYQLFDLTNAARVEHGLPILSWDDHVKETARDHSTDMAENQYFNHTNLEGQSPFDRMEEDNITFIAAGENLAAGQVSSIFAHEGLMNSLGHRENILNSDFESLGVGVDFDSESKPYYTENFLTR